VARFEADPEQARRLVQRSPKRPSAGDLDALLALLAEDNHPLADGGAGPRRSAPARARSVTGRSIRPRIMGRVVPAETTIHPAEINGSPGSSLI